METSTRWRDREAEGWERSDFPVVCESCLGPNPYVRMTRAEFDKECKICARPFTVFRWRPGADARFKKTEICQTCAKGKHVCQTCILDLDYAVPVQVRETALGVAGEDSAPKSAVHREFFAEQLERQLAEGGDAGGRARPNEVLNKLARTAPYYARNKAKICSFFVKGTCNRGLECPFRHEIPTTGDLSKQNLQDRYHGVNDPVAKKMLARAKEMPTLAPPEDRSICTLYVGGLTDGISEEDLKGHFLAFGNLKSVRKIEAKRCAFVTYVARADAEAAAAKSLGGAVSVKGERLKLMWGKPANKAPGAGPRAGAPGAGAGGARPAAPPATMMYPSMDPTAQGTRLPGPAKPAK